MLDRTLSYITQVFLNIQYPNLHNITMADNMTMMRNRHVINVMALNCVKFLIMTWWMAKPRLWKDAMVRPKKGLKTSFRVGIVLTPLIS